MDSTYTSLVSTLGIRLDDILDDAPIKYHSENVNSRPYFTRSTVAPGSVGTNRPIRLASGRTRCANSSLERGNLPGADNPGADNPVGQNTIAHIESSPESVVKGKITDVCADQDILKLQELLRVATINGEEGLYDYIFVGIISQHLDTVDTLLSNLAEDYSLRSWSIFYDLRDCQSAFLKEGGFLNEETPCSEAANLSSESEQHDKIVCAKEHDVRSRLILVGPLVTIDCLYNTIPLHIITNSQVFAYIPSSGQARGQSLVRGVDADSNVVWEGKLLAMFHEDSLAGKALHIINLSKHAKRIRLVMCLACWLCHERKLSYKCRASEGRDECRGPECPSFKCQVGKAFLTILGLEIQGLVSFRPMPTKLVNAIQWNSKREVYHAHILDLSCDTILPK